MEYGVGNVSTNCVSSIPQRQRSLNESCRCLRPGHILAELKADSLVVLASLLHNILESR